MKTRILIIKLDEIGDVILSTPVIRSLRAKHTQAELVLVVQPHVYPLVENCPYVDRVLTFKRRDERGLLKKIQKLGAALGFIIRNRLLFFNECILLRTQPYTSEYLLTLCSFARQRVGWISETIYWGKYCLNHVVAEQLGMHETHRMFGAIGASADFKEEAGLPALRIGKQAEQVGEKIAASHKKIVVLGCTKARISRRSWPVKRYAELVNQLKVSLADYDFIAVGGPADQAYVEELIQMTDGTVTSFAGHLSLPETCGLLKYSTLFIGNDSGPMHMAAAMGLPVVEISCHVVGGDPDHANAPERFGPVGVRHRICRPRKVVSPCVDCCVSEVAHCINMVSVSEVEVAVKGLVEEINHV